MNELCDLARRHGRRRTRCVRPQKVKKGPFRVKGVLTGQATQQVGVDSSAVALVELSVQIRVQEFHDTVAVAHTAASVLATGHRENVWWAGVGASGIRSAEYWLGHRVLVAR